MRTHKIRLNPVPSIGVTMVVDGSKKNKQASERLVFTSCTDENGLLQPLNIDQFSGKRFMLNDNGFPMNDIEAFETSQSDSVAQAVLQRIKEIHPESIPQNLTPEQMFSRVMPSNWSSPAEFVRASKMFAERFYNETSKFRAAQAAAAKAAAEVAKKSDPNSVKVEPE